MQEPRQVDNFTLEVIKGLRENLDELAQLAKDYPNDGQFGRKARIKLDQIKVEAEKKLRE